MMVAVLARSLVEWGDVPTWVGACASVGSLLLTALAAVVAYRLLKVEQRRDVVLDEQLKLAAEDRAQAAQERLAVERERLARQEHERRAQAELVCAWASRGPETVQDMPGQQVRIPGPGSWGAHVRNASQLLIYNVEVAFLQVEPDGTVPGPSRGYAEVQRVVPPSEGTTFFPCPEQVLQQTATAPEDWLTAVSVRFTDAAGAWWRREPDGQLVEIDPNETLIW
jgi:hypothetical protein